ncbi:uncharacterized protein LTR77_009392 [Saxophila tyrrhenica]|uniref:Kelch repeat protein n=1 Tax=Saxophila tyrrhenica TaxID=1690608 RepID=A0AAV9NZ26_9PEZI|nr:hypothetical protein LTR77_009392 [Saxophila tyrrhenica]
MDHRHSHSQADLKGFCARPQRRRPVAGLIRGDFLCLRWWDLLRLGTDSLYDVNLVTISVPGMVMFDTFSQNWYNLSTDAISYFGTAVNGATHFVPSFGPKGLLFMLGGVSPSGRIVSWPDTFDHPGFPFDSLWMFDPWSQQWLSQSTSGQAPASVQYPCAVGLEGDDDTYEIFKIFVYGGISDDVAGSLSLGSGAVYVLSLPSFHWTRQDDTPQNTRRLHTCNLAGNRQMIVVGGEIITANSNVTKDPWPVGVGVFDLSDMKWRDSYDPSASEYVTPQAVRTHLKSSGRYPSSWSDDTVKSWFIGEPNSSSASTSSSNSSDDSTNVGAIAGGVVGGVVGLAAIVALIWLVLRKRKSTSASQSASPEYMDLSERGSHSTGEAKVELDSEQGAYEMEQPHKPVDMDNGVVSELEGSWKGHGYQDTMGPGDRTSGAR